MKQVLFLVFFLLFSQFVFSQNVEKKYKLIDKTSNAEFNYAVLMFFDTIPPQKIKRLAFTPIKGKFIVYRFIATFIGESYTGENKEFHDILIIKTNLSGKILDAFQYTLEWSEVPSSTDLYRSIPEGLYLKNNLKLNDFSFFKAFACDEGTLKDFGVINLN